MSTAEAQHGEPIVDVSLRFIPLDFDGRVYWNNITRVNLLPRSPSLYALHEKIKIKEKEIPFLFL